MSERTLVRAARRRGSSDGVVAATALVIGSLSAIGLGAVLEAARGFYGETNVAITLALVVVVAASFGDRVTGVLVGITAALSFNFFHARPYHSLRIADARDVLTVALFPVIGVVVGQLSVVRQHVAQRARDHEDQLRQVQRVISMVSEGEDLIAVWSAVRAALLIGLQLREVRFDATGTEPSAIGALPTIEANGAIRGTKLRYVGSGFALPKEGVTIVVRRFGIRLGYLVLTPERDLPTTGEQRRTGVVLAHQLAMALPDAEIPSLR